jgi:hypothetical protein
MCLNETYSRVFIGKNLSDKFTVQNGLKQGDALSPLLLNFALEYAIRRVQEKQVKVKKGKAVPLHAMEAFGGERRYSSYSFTTSALDRKD